MSLRDQTVQLLLPETFTCRGCAREMVAEGLDPFDRVSCPSCDQEIIVPGWLDRFLVYDEIGQGGMGVVYLAEDTSLQRPVAIKALKADMVAPGETFEKLLAEAKAAARLNHPHIATVYSFESSESGVYMVMEHLDGESLKHALKSKRPLPVRKVIGMMQGLTKALAKAEAAGLTHSDVKPANIMLSADGEAKLVDFGLARFAQDPESDGKVWGSPFYVAPERLAKQAPSSKGDQYSLGATMWHALTGREPFKGATMKATLANVRTTSVKSIIDRNDEVPPDLEEVILRMMAKEPEERYPDYAALQADLELVQYQLGVDSTTTGLLSKSQRLDEDVEPEEDAAPLTAPRRKNRLWLLLVLLLVLVGGGAAAYFSGALDPILSSLFPTDS